MKRVPEKFEFRPIGVARTPFKEPRGAPIQPVAAENARGEIEIYAEFAEGLLDIEGFSHIVVLYAFHLSEGYNLTPKPFLEDVPHGVFAVRAPRRPNPSCGWWFRQPESRRYPGKPYPASLRRYPARPPW